MGGRRQQSHAGSGIGSPCRFVAAGVVGASSSVGVSAGLCCPACKWLEPACRARRPRENGAGRECLPQDVAKGSATARQTCRRDQVRGSPSSAEETSPAVREVASRTRHQFTRRRRCSLGIPRTGLARRGGQRYRGASQCSPAVRVQAGWVTVTTHGASPPIIALQTAAGAP